MQELLDEYKKIKRENIKKLLKNYNSILVEHNQGWKQVDINNEKEDIESEFCGEKNCRKCGRCCSQFSCVFSPGDFTNFEDQDYMLNILKTGLVGFGLSEHYQYIIRPRGKQDDSPLGKRIGSYMPYGKNTCLLLTNNGCLLPDICRPSQGLLYYVKEEDYFCGIIPPHKALYSDFFFEKEYEQYQDYLKELFMEYEKIYQDISFDNIEQRKDQLIKCLCAKKK